uniref:Uncharacterized protein n=1 Tax=Kalanchoe fedtschenkoi TaxID=63787 RepID=A0A7N0T0U0_KALFE
MFLPYGKPSTFLVLFLIVSSSMFQISFSARFMRENRQTSTTTPPQANVHNGMSTDQRFFSTATTQDYGVYDPPPSLLRPPAKLIPNFSDQSAVPSILKAAKYP